MLLQWPGRPNHCNERIMRAISTNERGELTAFPFLVQLDYWSSSTTGKPWTPSVVEISLP
jgi:hypothetical protein